MFHAKGMITHNIHSILLLSSKSTLKTGGIESLTDSRPFRYLCCTLAPPPIPRLRTPICTYCVCPSCTSSPFGQRLCICPWATSPPRSASPSSSVSLSSCSALVSGAPCQASQQSSRRVAGVRAGGTFGVGRGAMGLSCASVNVCKCAGGVAEAATRGQLR